MHDAVILEFDVGDLAPGAAWRVKSVDILPMISDFEFETAIDGQDVSVEVWDGDDPTDSEPFTVTQEFDKDALEWEEVTLTNPSTAWDPFQRFASWTFDFTDTIPVTGLENDGEYLVGVVWDGSARPTMGYSNFELSCARNWTNYDDGTGFRLNDGGMECSWPMLRVEIEVLQEQAFCEEGSVVVD